MTKGKAKVNGITRVHGRCLVSAALTGGAGILNLGPSAAALGQFSSKLLSVSDAFALYRFTRMTVEVTPYSTNGAFFQIGYNPEITATAPTTSATVTEAPFSTPQLTGNPSSLIYSGTYACFRKEIPSRLLLSTGVPWFRTRESASYDDNLEFQGQFYFVGIGTSTYNFVVEYTLELKDFVGTAQTPAVPRPPLPSPSEDEKEEYETVVVRKASRTWQNPIATMGVR